MKITFIQYLLFGFVGVMTLWKLIPKILQYDLCPYKGHDKLVLFLTRDASQEGHVYGPRTFTLWNLSHVVYYALGAYLFPDKAFLLWCLGVVWEISEVFFNSSNLLDILWNSIGILIGLQLRN